MRVLNLLWGSIVDIGSKIVPPLTHSIHKGEMGRIGVIGGSREYCGAPYYAAQASLYFGADLASVFCASEASVPIKNYSPELMVYPFYSHNDLQNTTEYISSMVSTLKETAARLHVVVIGPGLGRVPAVLTAVGEFITWAKDKSLPLVIDADGLWLLSQDIHLVQGYKKCILTPNVAEFSRLVEAVEKSYHISINKDSMEVQVYELSKALGGLTILLKGENDIIGQFSDPHGFAAVIQDSGSPRRCGGQGDILSGCIAISLHWALMRKGYVPPLHLLNAASVLDTSNVVYPIMCESDEDAVPWAAFLGSVVMKTASRMAYNDKGRAMTSPDVLSYIGRAFASIHEH